MEERSSYDEDLMLKDINGLLERLKFLDEESVQVVSTNAGNNLQGFESWAVGKFMAEMKPNREAMYRVFRSLWFTKEDVDFVALNDEVIIGKFGCVEDRSRILNLTPWLFDNCLFSMLPFVKGQAITSYEFNMSPFWLRIYNIPLELMDHSTALDVGIAIGKVVAIDWKDRNGGWTEFMRLKIMVNILKPLRRIVKLVDRDERVITCMLKYEKYERLPDFCYLCGIIGHTVKNCKNKLPGLYLIRQTFNSAAG